MTDRADPDDSGAIQITVLEKTYHMLCPDEERESLLAAAAALDEELQGIQRNLGVSKTETLAIMGALHITQELLRCQQAHGTGPAEPARPAEVASAPVSAPVSQSQGQRPSQRRGAGARAGGVPRPGRAVPDQHQARPGAQPVPLAHASPLDAGGEWVAHG